MKILKHFKQVSILLIMFLFMASSSFAATWYVNNTNGDDLNFDGTTTATPFRTIGAAMAAASDGDVISVAADFYTENVTVAKDLTFVVETNVSNILTKATVTGNLVVNNNGNGAAPGITGAVSIGVTGLELEFTGDLTLTDGAVSITSANVRFVNNPLLVTVDDGTINNTPTYVNNIVNVTYITGANRSTGAELPGNLNGGALVNTLVGASRTLTVTKNVVVDMFDNSTGQDAVFDGTLLVETSTLNNSGGDITFKSLATFESDMNNSTGNLVFEAGFVVNVANILNTLGGSIDVQANSSITDGNITNNVAGVIKLNATTLVVENATVVAPGISINNGGNIISATASAVGNGVLQLIGDNPITITGGGEVPNLTIPNTLVVGGSVTLGADIDVYGDLTLDAGIAGALVDGGFTINMYGDFLRTNDIVPTSFVATGLLAFRGAVDQVFDPGASLQIFNLTVSNNNRTVTMLASIEVLGNVNITATGNLELDTYNIRMLNTGTSFTNNGTYLSSATTGYVIFESGGVNTLQGGGKFSNIDVRDDVQPPAGVFTVVTLGSNIDFSGILRVRDGDLNFGGFNFNITDDFVATPDVYVYTADGTVTTGIGGDMTRTGTTVLYNLYFEEAAARVTNGEWTTTSALFLNNVTIGTSVAPALGGSSVTGPAGPSTIAGVLTVAGTEVLNLNAQAATLIGDGLNHPISGQVRSTELIVQGDASSITGSTTAAHHSAIENLTVDLASVAETFTSTGVRNITGNLTHNDGTSNIALANNNVAAPGTTGPTFLGNLALVDGQLTFGMTSVASTIVGTSTLTDGELILSSNIDVTGTTTQLAADLTLGTWDYEANAVYTHGPAAPATPGVVTGTTGFLILDYVGNFILNDDLSVSNLEIQNNITQTVGDLEVTNHWLSTTGTYNLVAQNVLLSGSTFDFEGGAFAATTGIYKFTGTTATLDIPLSMVNVTFDNGANGMTFVDGTNTNPTWTVTGDMLQTSGDVSMDDVDFIVDGGTFTRVAGAWSSTTAFFIFRNAPTAIDQGTGWTVDRLAVDGGAGATTADKAFTVNNYLRLAMSLDANDPALATAPWNLTLGDGATIERQANAATLVEEANYGTTVNLFYSTDAGGITTSDEASSSAIDEFKAEVPVTLDRDIMVNGELVIDSRNGVGNGMVNDNGFNLGMADGSLVTLVDVGGAAGLPGGLLDPQGTLNVYYDNATGVAVATSNNELSTTFTIGEVTIDGATAADEVQLHANHTVNGTLLINDDGDFNLVDNTLTLAGAYTTTSNGEITNAAPGVGTGAVLFGGATSSDINLNGDWTIPVGAPDYTLGINTTTPDVIKTLKGGDIDLEANGADLKLMKGVFATDATSNFILRHTDDGAQPVQGFTRSGDAHISGNVKKYLDATGTRYGRTPTQVATALTRVEFPTGSDPVASPVAPSHYRPYSLQFSNVPTAGTWITLNHTNSKPAGTNGMPLATGEGFTITNFSNFYWTMSSDITIQPSVLYHVEAAAEGYNDQYEDNEVQFIRFVRRFAANDANPWVLQGASGYDNSTDGTTAVVIAKDAEGAVSNQSAIFAYSQRNQAPHFTAELANPTNINEGDVLTQTYAIADNDVTSQTLEMFAVTLPAGATFDPATGVFEWTTDNYDAGTYTAKIGATDGIDTSYAEAIINVADVNAGVLWVSVPGTNDTASVAEGVLNTLQYTAATNDTDKVVIYSILAGPAGATIDAATGLVSLTPAWGTVGNTYNLQVQADDQAGAGNSLRDTTTLLLVVKTNRVPVIAPATVDTTVNEAQALALAFTATDLDLDALTFSLGAVAPAAATIDAATGAFAWTPGFTDAGVHTFNVWVTDDGVPNMKDSSVVTITVIDQNSPPVWTGELTADTVFVGDSWSQVFVAEDLDNDNLTYSFILPKPGSMTQTKVTNETVRVDWNPAVADTATYLIRQIVTDGTASDTTKTLLTVLITTVNVTGVVAYNTTSELLDAVTVTLSDGTTEWTNVTDATGAYSFTGVMAGAYTLSAAKTTQWGGALASDALETQLYVVGDDSTKLVTPLQKVAADVVGVGNITSSDALAILNRSVGINDFQVADWLFDGATITVGTSNLTQNLTGIAAGDARNDYSPAAGFAKIASIAVNSDEVLNIKKDSEFELPISISELAEIGSFTFKLKYDADKVEFLGVSTENGGMLVSNVVEDVISIAWVNLEAKDIKVKDGDALATLKFKATDKFGKADEVSLELLDGAEITDRMAKSFSSVINIPVVAIGIPDVFALRQNYPNPFNPSTTIQYDLPENGKVTLTIYNSLGQRVATLVNAKQVAGAYEVNFNASNLASGVYLYRVTVEGSKNFVMTKKMILMK